MTAAPYASLDEAADNETVLANADLALYAAKAAGRNRSCVFAPEQHARASERLSVQQRLAAALDHDALSLLHAGDRGGSRPCTAAGGAA